MRPTCICGQCKTCKHREWNHRWRERHRDVYEAYLAKRAAARRAPERTLVDTPDAIAGRERYARNRDAYLARRRQYEAENPEKKYAHSQVKYALQTGRLVRQPCEVCGKKAEAHHDDYSKPLEVRWLCRSHHYQIHQLQT